MRTTLNLDDDVSAALAAEARRRGRSLSRVANDLIRVGMRAARREREEAPPAYEPPVFDTGRPFVDVTDVAAALELLDDAR
jgi:hypothetical protein